MDTESFNTDSDGDDFPSMFTDLIGSVKWKTALFLFILMIFVFSNVYIDLVLNSVENATEADCPTNKGTLIQIFTVTVGYILLDLFISGGYL